MILFKVDEDKYKDFINVFVYGNENSIYLDLI